jgi:putative polyhydroxyalkanoate system protein
VARPVIVTIPHQLGRAQARTRIDEGFADLARHLGPGALGELERQWHGDRLSFAFTSLGQAISGYVMVADETVTVEVQLPGFLAMIARQVKGAVKKEGQLLLARK